MKIAVTALEPNLEGEMDTRFQQCPYFLLINLENKEYEAFENPTAKRPRSRGIGAAHFLVRRGVDVVITGAFGVEVFQFLSMAGIHLLTGISGPVHNVIEAYEKRELKESARFTPKWGGRKNPYHRLLRSAKITANQ